MADQTMAQRIMDAADDYQEAMTQTGRKRARAALAALVAEACAPQPERVCRWQGDRGFATVGCSGRELWRGDGLPGKFCPEPLDDVVSPCEGGRLVLAADVDALLARIQAAVEALDNAWRVLAEGEHLVGVCDNDTADAADRQALADIDSAREALDALLRQEVTDGQEATDD